jgi:hypothetical protein
MLPVADPKGTSEKVVDLNLGARIRRFFVENLRNSWLLRAIFAANRQILIANLFGPDFLRGSHTNLLCDARGRAPGPRGTVTWGEFAAQSPPIHRRQRFS